MATPTVAANAYASLARLMDSGSAAKPASLPGAATEPSFGDLLKQTLDNVVDSGRKSDAQLVAVAKGKANVMDVVTAVSDTDLAVSTLVSVRDRVITAYNQIMQMAI